MAAITDVAARAGVSTATVSRYLSGQQVRAAERIRTAIVELDYSPSRTARALKSGITYTVAIVVPDITNPFFAAVVRGIESMSRQGPYNISLYNTDEDPDRERQVIATVVSQVDGIILAPANEQDQTPELVRRAGIPLVFIDRTLTQGDEFDSVLVDNVGGGAAAARHLLDLGHRRIAIITGPPDTTPGRQRADGFAAEVDRRGVHLPEEYSRVSDFREAGGYRETLALLALPVPPTAIFSSNNEMTIGALKALSDMSVSIPGEMAIIGFDDLDLAELLNPPLTVIRRDAAEQGALAMRLLLKRLGGVRERPRSITLDTELVVRGSCAPPLGAATPRPASAPRRKGRS